MHSARARPRWALRPLPGIVIPEFSRIQPPSSESWMELWSTTSSRHHQQPRTRDDTRHTTHYVSHWAHGHRRSASWPTCGTAQALPSDGGAGRGAWLPAPGAAARSGDKDWAAPPGRLGGRSHRRKPRPCPLLSFAPRFRAAPQPRGRAPAPPHSGWRCGRCGTRRGSSRRAPCSSPRRGTARSRCRVWP